jgi:hypothetical protein
MATGELYQQYELLRRADCSLWELGRGAMGITYKAYDTNLRCPVALKVINSTYLESDTARRRFLREARAAATLRHPNVASVFNLSTQQDNYFYVMEFIDGETVDARIKREGPMKPAEALSITLQVARALTAAAKQQLVHRDLKPANLMLVDQESETIVKVIDFGLAKSARDTGEDSGTLTAGEFVGTPYFASPEQFEEGEVDIRSDIYSLGCTLYFMMTGKSPFVGSIGAVMIQHFYKPVALEPLTNLPGCVVSLIQHMMEKNRDQRPQTPGDLQEAILDCLEQIRARSTRGVRGAGEAPRATLSPGRLLAQNYRLIEEFRDIPEGRRFLAEDLLRNRQVNLLVLNEQFVSDCHRFTALEAAAERLRNAPHPMLRAIYSLETVAGYDILVEEHVIGLSLLDLLRSRRVFSAPEVMRLLSRLAPLADHASAHLLEYVDLTLLGIHLVGTLTEGEIQSELLRLPLTAWDDIEPKVNAIDFLFSPSPADTDLAIRDFGEATRTPGPASSRPRASEVRLLSLLAYELLGGLRARVEETGQYTPIATLTEEGNAVLRRGLVDECPSAAELARQFAAVHSVSGLAAPQADRLNREPIRRAPPLKPSTNIPLKRTVRQRVSRLVPAAGLLAFIGIGGYMLYRSLHPPTVPEAVFGDLTVKSEPPGASILLDGNPPQKPPNTFTHVPFGTHQLSGTLKDFEPLTQSIEVHKGMTAEIQFKLNQKPDPIQVLLTEAKKYDEGSPQRLAAYVRLVQASMTSGAPDAGEYSKELGRIIERLRTKVPPISKDEFSLSYEGSVKDAANLNLLPAIVWLAENATGSEAFNLFLRAANLGDSYAMMKVGRLYLQKGTATEDAEGFSWLNRAFNAPSRNLQAGAYVGECYLDGRGTKRDVQKAEEISLPLANQNVAPAMTLASRILLYKSHRKRAEAGASTDPQMQKKLEA